MGSRSEGRRRSCALAAVTVVGLISLIGAMFGGASAAAAAPSTAAPVEPAGVSAQASDSPSYVPVSPARLMDTRSGQSTVDGQFRAQGPFANVRELVVAGRGNVPASGVAAVALNVTVVGPASAGYTTVWPTGTARPNASNVNYAAGKTVPNVAIVKVGTGGRVSLFNSTSAHILVDVAGWFSAAGEYSALTPARLTDTRPGGATIDGLARAGGAFSAARTLTVAGRGGVPASGVGAVVVNLTITGPSGAGYATVYPTGTARPNASNLNFTKGLTVANQAIVKVGNGGQITLFNSTTSHVIVDVVGWFPLGSQYTALNPARIMDSRPSGVTVDGQSKNLGLVNNVNLSVVGRGSVPSSGVGAVVLNVTTTGSRAGTGRYVTVHPAGEARPNASNLNFEGGQTVANLVLAKVGAGGQVTLYSSAGTHLIVDVLGWLPIDKAAQVSTGFTHSCAVSSSGAAKCWGRNRDGELGDGTTTNRSAPAAVLGLSSGVQQVATSRTASCALLASGGVKCWGSIGGNTPTDVVGLTSGIASIDGGDGHFCAVTTGGGLRCWGSNQQGQLGVGDTAVRANPVTPTGLGSGIRQVAAGVDHTCAVTTSGAAKCWGANDFGKLGNGDRLDQLVAADVAGQGSGVESITTGSNNSCLLRSSGAVLCWGYGPYVGNGGTSPVLTPADVTGLGSGVVSVRSGINHTCAVLGTGAARCWGAGNFGQLGDGAEVLRTTPVNVAGLGSGVAAIDGGNFHSCAVLANGTLRCWGENGNAQLGTGNYTGSDVPVGVVGFT